jgi:hypothetical protein
LPASGGFGAGQRVSAIGSRCDDHYCPGNRAGRKCDGMDQACGGPPRLRRSSSRRGGHHWCDPFSEQAQLPRRCGPSRRRVSSRVGRALRPLPLSPPSRRRQGTAPTCSEWTSARRTRPVRGLASDRRSSESEIERLIRLVGWRRRQRFAGRARASNVASGRSRPVVMRASEPASRRGVFAG